MKRLLLTGIAALAMLAGGAASIEALDKQKDKTGGQPAARGQSANQAASKAPAASAAPMAGLARPSASVAFLDGAVYVGSAACKDCHAAEFQQWSASGHANMLRPVTPGIVKGDFNGLEIVFEGVEVEDADKNKVKISPRVRAETKDGRFFVALLDADKQENSQTYEVVEVLGSLWEQQYYLKVGDKIFPSPIRWVEKDKQWRKAAFAPIWWAADATPDGRPRSPGEMPARQTVDYQCNGCHTTAFNAAKDAQGKYVFSRMEGGVGCEACHGPGSRHVQAGGHGMIVSPAKLGTLQREQLCGQCHFRVTSKQDKDFAFPLGFRVGMTDLQDRAELWSYSTRPANFWPNEDSRKNRQQYHDTMRSAHLASGVNCSSCHLDHATEHLAGSLKKPRDQQCVNCHAAQKALYEGSPHAQKGVTCVDCHMAKMGNRAGATQKTPKDPIDVTAHTMRPVLPMDAAAYKMRSSCEGCHKDAALAGTGSKMEEARALVLGKLGEAKAALNVSKASEAMKLKAGEKIAQVALDGSVGAHNPARALELLAQAVKDAGGK
jgi:hypothetical protein